MFKSLKDLGINDKNNKGLTYLIFNYKSVVFCQSANGLWTNKLYTVLKQKNLPELLAMQATTEAKKMTE